MNSEQQQHPQQQQLQQQQQQDDTHHLPALRAPLGLAAPGDVSMVRAVLLAGGGPAGLEVRASACSGFHYLLAPPQQPGAPAQAIVPVSARSRHLSFDALQRVLGGVGGGGSGGADGGGEQQQQQQQQVQPPPPRVNLAFVDGTSVSQVQLHAGLQPPSERAFD